LSGWGNWKISCVKIVFAWINGEDDIISVCLSVYFFSDEISQNIWSQKYKGSLYSVSWKIFTNFVRFFFLDGSFYYISTHFLVVGQFFTGFAKSKALALVFLCKPTRHKFLFVIWETLPDANYPSIPRGKAVSRKGPLRGCVLVSEILLTELTGSD
jgi:hypothetical protein